MLSCLSWCVAPFLVDFLTSEDRRRIVLVTGRTSYGKCGAERFMLPILDYAKVHYGTETVRLSTVGENARAEDVRDKMVEIADFRPDAYIAIGGGTVIDTTKLLRAGFPEDLDSRRGSPLPDFVAMPTTAGTGAEATQFAVYYDHGVKKSADDPVYLPTDVALVPEFTLSQTPYQRACTEFDAYAQAVESLWAKGATDESRIHANEALRLFRLNDPTAFSHAHTAMLAAYQAGRAINLSRTTAAHAFSYYLTANFGVPHGEAVYMMFPYVCRANGHPEFVRSVSELRTLDDFVRERDLNRDELIDRLFENVNPARLGNNPNPVAKAHFKQL